MFSMFENGCPRAAEDIYGLFILAILEINFLKMSASCVYMKENEQPISMCINKNSSNVLHS